MKKRCGTEKSPVSGPWSLKRELSNKSSNNFEGIFAVFLKCPEGYTTVTPVLVKVEKRAEICDLVLIEPGF